MRNSLARRHHIEPKFVEYIPKELDEGIIYVSQRFKTASHLCCCGCGQKVVTPLNPAKWRLTVHGATVSLDPSIGLGTLPCRSHYWIRQSRIDWYADMTDEQTAWAQRSDEYASKVFTGEIKPPPPRRPAGWFAAGIRKFIDGVVAFFRSLWK
ncbi:DUF6527 family protein [Bradyrhizobium sp. B117]|uniref:DUF6527 family protein n=1 Tax=Bradyrhizobium sp. B117 TaxID=3140246 RepID=UPI0031831D4C